MNNKTETSNISKATLCISFFLDILSYWCTGQESVNQGTFKLFQAFGQPIRVQQEPIQLWALTSSCIINMLSDTNMFWITVWGGEEHVFIQGRRRWEDIPLFRAQHSHLVRTVTSYRVSSPTRVCSWTNHAPDWCIKSAWAGMLLAGGNDNTCSSAQLRAEQ